MNSIFPNAAINPTESFRERQFSATSTIPQAIFDIAFGIFMPVVCLYLDPGLLRDGLAISLPNISIFVYTFSFLAMLTLALWLAFGQRTRSSNGIFAGILLSGAVSSFAIGVVILPLTIVGLFLVIGFLGFVPFVTAFVYLRNTVRAINRGRALIERPALVGSVVLSGLLVVGAAAFAQWEINQIVEQSMNDILSRDSGSTDAAIQRIRYFRSMADTDRIMRSYQEELDPGRKEMLARAYREITGEDLQRTIANLND